MGNIQVLKKAEVTKILADSDKNTNEKELNMVEVRFSNNQTTKAEVLSWFASKEKAGVVSVPQIGDEVLVGLVDDRLQDAVVLGSLNNSKNLPSLKVDNKNEVLFNMVTRKGHMIVINDGADLQQIEIKSKPAQEGQPSETSLKIDFKNGEIMLAAKTKITLQVGNAQNPDSLVLEGGKGLTLTSKQGDFSISSNNIKMAAQANGELTANSNLTLKGNASCSIN